MRLYLDMGTVATVKGQARGLRAKAPMLVLLVPVIGVFVLIWKASHTIAKPEISIYRAAERGQYEDVQAHILTGTPVNGLSSDGHSPLYYAVLSGRKDVVDLLLSNGANPNAEGVGQTTPLYVAAGQGNLAIVKDLVAAGADMKARANHGASALFAAADSGNPEIINLLLAAGNDPNARLTNTPNTVLCNACIKGNLQTVKILLDHGAQIEARGFSGRTPLSYATSNAHLEVVQLLLDRGADADTRDDNDVPPISGALAMHVDERIAWTLLRHMKHVQGFDYHLCNPLHYAADSGASVPMIKALLARGCDPNQVNFQGLTPLDFAMNKDRHEIETALVEGGARASLRQMIRRELEPNNSPIAKRSPSPVD